MLTLQLRELERDGLVLRKVHPQVPPRVEYTLTAAAVSVLPILESLGSWVVDNRVALGVAGAAPDEGAA